MGRSLCVAKNKLEIVQQSFELSGYPSQQAFSEDMLIHRSTISKFLNGRPVDRGLFQEICDRLDLDWRDLVDTGTDPQSPVKTDSISVVPTKPGAAERSSTLSDDRLNLIFLDHEQALADLDQLAKQHRAIVIQGVGSVGKTTLARDFLRSRFEQVIELSMAKETKNIASAESVVENWLVNEFQQNVGQDFGTSLLRLRRQLQDKQVGILINNLDLALDKAGELIPEHRNYVELLRALTDPSVRSFTILTSRSGINECSLMIYSISDMQSIVAASSTQFVLRYRSRTALQYIEDLGNGITLEVLKISGGTFLMGSPTDELDRYEDEGPQHTVIVPDFFLGKYPITQAQWRAICALPPVNPDLILNPNLSHFTADFQDGERVINADQRPVEQVNWYEATEACDRLAQATGRPYCLPSEAQWEYACRAGTTTPFHFGETLTSEVANYNANNTYGRGSQGHYRAETTPVGYFPPNAWGLHDMHGNVWEWCADHGHSSYQGAPVDGSSWNDHPSIDRQLLRGGSCLNNPRLCRSAARFFKPPDHRANHLGFRVGCATTRTLEAGLVVPVR